MSEHPKEWTGHPPGTGPDRPAPAAPGERRRGQARWRRPDRDISYRNPEVRREKVARLKEAIARNAYEIDAGLLAAVIIVELLWKRGVKM
ncbi:MAG: flagellar biosynthesis anti-sigma factor FlgM [Desulfobaccales bacterium]